MLLAIMVILHNYGTTDLQIISLSEISIASQLILFLGFFLSFAVKTPLVPFHLWLFRAHAEAPLAGSIILAAIKMVAKFSTLSSLYLYEFLILRKDRYKKYLAIYWKDLIHIIFIFNKKLIDLSVDNIIIENI